MDNIKRGEMFYISRGGVSYNGSEQHSDRPAVVVSNDKNNENSNVVEVVYMTTQPKTDLPTHVTVRSTGRPSTVLCEQVYSVSTERIGTYIGECSDKEMENIDIALMISLQLDGNMKTSKKYNETIKEQQEEIDLYRKKIQAMQEALKEKENEKPEITASSEETIRLQTERDTYKTMYEQLLNRLVKAEFINAKIKDAKYIGVSIKTEGSSQPEIIINPRENFDAKFDYYMEAYDDDLILIAAKGKKDIRIVAAGHGNRFEDIENQLIWEKGKGWRELIAGAIDNAYDRLIASTPPQTEEEKTHCEMIKEAVKGMFINESRTAAEAEFIKTHIIDYEKIFDVCMNGDDLEFKKGLVRLQKMQNEYVMQREREETANE